MTDSISMTRNDYTAIEHARDHCVRALSAVRAAAPFDSSALVLLDQIRKQLTGTLATLTAIKNSARVSE